MDLFQLHTFLAVAREGSFSRAAKALHRTQPAISQTIRKLEDEIGESLFDRSSRDGILTDAGIVLRDYSERLLNLRGETLTALEELRKLQAGKLSLAANEFTCLWLLPVLDEFRRIYPLVKITVQRSLGSRIPQELVNHNAEIGVLTFRPEDSELSSIVVYCDELAFVVPPRHPLAHTKNVTIRQLGAESFVAHNVSSSYRKRVIETFQKRRVPLNMPVELPTLDAIKKFVAAGNGVALLPRLSVEPELTRGELVAVSVPELHFERKIRLVHRKNGAMSHAGRAFLQVASAKAKAKDSKSLFQPEH